MKAGFTGTQGQRGMTTPQLNTLRRCIEQSFVLGDPFTEWHHGDCVGADEQSHAVATMFKIPVHLHPGDNTRKRAYCQGAAVTYPIMDNLERNTVIAQSIDVLYATPKEPTEVLRSGTWSTIRRGLKFTPKVVVILPDGQISIHYSKGV